MNDGRKTLRLGATAASILYSVALYAFGVPLDEGLRKALAYVPALVAVAAVVFDLWLWKLPGLNHLTGRPRLDGTWAGTLAPHPQSHVPEGGNRGPINVAVIIEQSYWFIAVALLTLESSSLSTAAAIRSSAGSRQRRVLAYTYTNSPKQEHRTRSQIHKGAAELQIVGLRPVRITGTYWTDRLTLGDVDLRHLNRHTDYATYGEVEEELRRRDVDRR